MSSVSQSLTDFMLESCPSFLYEICHIASFESPLIWCDHHNAATLSHSGPSELSATAILFSYSHPACLACLLLLSVLHFKWVTESLRIHVSYETKKSECNFIKYPKRIFGCWQSITLIIMKNILFYIYILSFCKQEVPNTSRNSFSPSVCLCEPWIEWVWGSCHSFA